MNENRQDNVSFLSERISGMYVQSYFDHVVRLCMYSPVHI